MCLIHGCYWCVILYSDVCLCGSSERIFQIVWSDILIRKTRMQFSGQLHCVTVIILSLMYMSGSSAQSSSESSLSDTWMKKLIDDKLSVARRCVAIHFDNSVLAAKVEPYAPQNETEETRALVVIEITCRDHVDPFLACLEKDLGSSNRKFDGILLKILDFPRLRALKKYLCDRKDVISSKYTCLHNETIAYNTNNVTKGLLEECFGQVRSPVELLVNHPSYNETTVWKVFKAFVKAGYCLKPPYQKCGELGTTIEHTLSELTLMSDGVKMTSGAPPTGHAFLLVGLTTLLAQKFRTYF